MTRFRLLLLLVAAVTITACLEAPPFVPKIEDVNFAASLGVDLGASTKTESGLYYRNIVVGGGTLVRSDSGGDTVSIRYTGYLRSGDEFDSNVGLALLTFTTGAGTVIDGMDEGVRGMRAGGTRQLIIPPKLGYGNNPNGAIPANSILIFTVEAVTVKTSAAAP